MIISGIVIRTSGCDAIRELMPILATESRITPGTSREDALAAAISFNDLAEGEALHEWLLALPGVRAVDVVHVEYDQPNEVMA